MWPPYSGDDPWENRVTFALAVLSILFFLCSFCWLGNAIYILMKVGN